MLTTVVVVDCPVDTMYSCAVCRPTASAVTSCSKLIAMLTVRLTAMLTALNSRVEVNVNSKVNIELDN